MIPYICGGIGMVVWGRVSDAMNERHWNLLVACVLSTGGHAGHVAGTGRNVVGRNRVLRLQGAVLRYAADVPQRHGARGAGSHGSTRSATWVAPSALTMLDT